MGQSSFSFDVLWESYTPVLTAVTTNPTLGAGSSASGRFCKLGTLGIIQASFSFGTGAAAGSGTYRISLPSAIKFRVGALNTGGPAGSVFVYDSSSGIHRTGIVRPDLTNGVLNIVADSGATAMVSNSIPWVWADNDQIHLMCFMECDEA